MAKVQIEKIYAAHVDKIYGFFYYRSFDVSIAEDLTSQTFLIFVEKLKDSKTAMKDPERFLYGVMRNVWLRHLQAKYREVELVARSIDDFQDFVADEVSGEQRLPDIERVKAFINKLPPAQAKVMTMRLIEQRTLPEICKITKKDMNYVKTTQKRGIKRLKELIDQAGITGLEAQNG